MLNLHWLPDRCFIKKMKQYGVMCLQLTCPRTKKKINRYLEEKGFTFEWADIKQDLTSLQEISIEDNGKS